MVISIKYVLEQTQSRKKIILKLIFFSQELARALSKWCFKMSGVLRVVSVDHHLASDPKGNPPAAYTIKVPK
jgi:hypothetical protein